MSNDNNEHDNDNKDGKMKIVFAEGCFDNFDGTQEELDEMIAELHRMVEDGSFFENATEVSPDAMLGGMLASVLNSADMSTEEINDIMKEALAEALKETGEDFDIDPEVMDLSRMISTGNTRH